MALARRGSRPTALRSLPGHYFEVQNVDVVEIVFAVPSSKDVHFGPTNYVGRVVEPGWRRSSSAWTLIPSHCDWVKRVKIFESLVLAALATKYDDSGACEQSGVAKSRGWRSSLDLWLDPPTRVEIEDMGIVQVDVSLLRTSVVVATKVEDGGTDQRG